MGNPQQFQFVDSAATMDRVTRRLMRSHVMRGKNAGKTVHRRSRLDLVTGAGRTPRNDASFPDKDTRDPDVEELGPVARSLGNPLRMFKFPVELSHGSLRTIDQFFIFITEKMYPSQLKLSSNEYKYDWLLTTFIDKEASYCSLALMESTNEFFISGGISSPKALSYLSNTLSLVKRRMEGEAALSDSTLCMVMMLILQEQIRHEKTSHIHYEGLRRMIKLRGGLSQLESCPTLLLKMSKMDILYALRYGKPVLFFRDHMSKVRSTLPSTHLNIYTHSASGLDLDLQKILVDVMSITTLFNDNQNPHTLEINKFLEILISICCRLLQFRPLQSPKPETKREAALHIGLITFMTTLFLQWDNRRIREYHLITTRLREILNEDFNVAHDGDLCLWLLFIASLWFPTSTRSHDDWLVLRIGSLARQLDVDSWSRVRNYICKFPWINVLHEKTGRAVWDLVYRGPQDDSPLFN